MRGEGTEVFAVKIPVPVAVLETLQRLCVPAGEIAIDKADLAVGTILFADDVQNPARNVFWIKGMFDHGEFTQIGDIDGILSFGPVKDTCLRQFTDFFDDFEAGFLGILWRNETLERNEAAEHGIFFHVEAIHQRIVELVQLRGL